MNKSTRTILICIATLALVYSAAWHYFARQFENHVEQQLAAVQKKGMQVSFERLKISGFPFGYDIKVKNLEIKRGELIKAWIDDDITFSGRLWNPKEIASIKGGTHHAIINNLKIDGHGFKLKYFALDRLNFKFTYDDLLIHMNEQELLKVNGLEYNIDFTPENKESSAELEISLKELQAPAIQGNPLGDKVENIHLAAELQGDTKGDTALEKLKSWFESDGTLEVKNIALKWGELKAKVEGTLSVDEELQPVGAFTASIEGTDKALDVLVSREILDHKTAEAVKVAFTLFMGEDSKISFTIQDRRLLLGSIPVYKIPRIEWK